MLLQGLDTTHPEICLSGGQCLSGEYEDTLGTQLFLEEAASVPRPASSTQGGHVPKVLGMSEKTIRFKTKNAGAGNAAAKSS